MLERRRLRWLVSYAYLRKSRAFEDVLLALEPYVELLVDSGAFTNRMIILGKAKGQTPFDLSEYVAACRRYHGRVWQYIQLDVVKEPDATATNLSAMLDAGLRPMPVWVENADPARVPDLVALNEWICVAGGVGTPDKYVHRRYQTAYNASGGMAKIHALGFLRWPNVFQLPIASGDSSSFSAGQRFGSIAYFDPLRGVQGAPWRDLKSADARSQAVIRRLLACKVPQSHWTRQSAYASTVGIGSILTVDAYLDYQSFAETRGFRLFLAPKSLDWLTTIIATAAAKRNGGPVDYPVAVEYYREGTRLRERGGVAAVVAWAEPLLRRVTDVA